MKKIEFVISLTLLTIASLSTSTVAQTRGSGLPPSYLSSQVTNLSTNTLAETQYQASQPFQDAVGSLATGTFAQIQYPNNQTSQSGTRIELTPQSEGSVFSQLPPTLTGQSNFKNGFIHPNCLIAMVTKDSYCDPRTGHIISYIPEPQSIVPKPNICFFIKLSIDSYCDPITGEIKSFLHEIDLNPVGLIPYRCLVAHFVDGADCYHNLSADELTLFEKLKTPCMYALLGTLDDCYQVIQGSMGMSNSDDTTDMNYTLVIHVPTPPEPSEDQSQVNQDTVARKEAAAQAHQDQVQREEDERAHREQAADEANRYAAEQKLRAEESQRNAEAARKQANESQNEKDIANANAAQTRADEDQHKAQMFATDVFIANLQLKIQTVKVEVLQEDARNWQTIADNFLRQFVVQQPLGKPFLPNETNHGMYGNGTKEANFISIIANLFGIPLILNEQKRLVPNGEIIPRNLVNYFFRFPGEAISNRPYKLMPDQILAFKNEERFPFQGDDFLMNSQIADILHYAAVEFQVRFPGYGIAVTEALDRQGEHSSQSLHYCGCAADLTIFSRSTGLKVSDPQILRETLGALGRIITQLGADFVHFELPDGYGNAGVWHIHFSVGRYYVLKRKPWYKR